MPPLHVDLGIGRAQGEIIRGDVGLEGEQDIFIIGQAGLRLVAGGFEGAAELAPDIDLVAQVERHHRGRIEGVGLAAAAAGVCAIELAVIRRGPLAGAGAAEIERREKIGLRLPGDGARFAHPRDGGAQRLVGRCAWASSSFSFGSWKILYQSPLEISSRGSAFFQLPASL